MESPLVPRKEAPSAARQFITMIEKLKSSKESVDAMPLSPKSMGETMKKYPNHKLLRVDENGGFIDLLVKVACAFESLMPLNSVSVVPFNSGMYLLAPREEHRLLVDAMIVLEKTVLDYNNIETLNTPYMPLYKENIFNQSLRRHSANKNEQCEKQLQEFIKINDELKKQHAEKQKSQEEQIKKLQVQLAYQNKMGERLFTKKTVIAAGIGAIVSACGFAAYLKRWQKK